MPVSELFLSHSIAKLAQMTGIIETCLEKLDDEQIWRRAGDPQNAIGNLVLHLCGNVRQWIGWSIGGLPDIRLRDAEFSTDNLPRAELAAKLKTTMREAVDILEKFPEERLGEIVRTQDGERSALEVIYQVVGHFQQHTGQIIFATKLFTNEDLKLYRPPKKSA